MKVGTMLKKICVNLNLKLKWHFKTLCCKTSTSHKIGEPKNTCVRFLSPYLELPACWLQFPQKFSDPERC